MDKLSINYKRYGCWCAGVALCILAGVVIMLAQDGRIQYSGTAPGTSASVPLAGSGIVYHKLSWSVTGTIATCSVQVDSSANGSTWTSGGVIGAQTCTSNGQSSVVNANVNYIRINATVLTGGGTLTANWAGYRTNPATGGTMTSVNIIAGTNVTIGGTCNSTTAVSCIINSSAGGTPGSPSLSLQGNNAGAFAGVPGSSIDFTTGFLTLNPPGVDSSDATAPFTVTGDSAGDDAVHIVNSGFENGGALSATSNGTDASFGAAAASFAANLTDPSGSGQYAIGFLAFADTKGANTATDVVQGIYVQAASKGTAGAPASVSGAVIDLTESSGVAPVTEIGLQVMDVTNTGGTAYAIQTGAGKVNFGDHVVYHNTGAAVGGTGCTASGTISDSRGAITLSTGATSCTVTFGKAFTNPVAGLSASATAILPVVSSLSTTVLTIGVSAASGTVYYSVDDVN